MLKGVSRMDEKREMQNRLNQSLSGLKEDPFLAQRVIAQGKGEPEMKKKISFAFVLAMVLLLLLAVAAVAEVLGVNVFELFGKTDTRYAELAPYTTLESTPEVSVNSEELGQTDAAINSAYYDGTSLIVGYAIRNGSHMEEYLPDETLAAEMMQMDNNLVWAADNDEEGKLITAWVQARDEGRKAGLVQYHVWPSDHTETDDGIDISPRTEETRTGEDGLEYTMREYNTPLTEELRNLDQLTNLVVLSVMLFNVLVIMAVPILRRKYPDIERPYKVWFYPVSVILVAAIFIGLFVQGAVEDPINGFVGFIVPIVGAIVYFIFDKKNKKEASNE